MEEFVNYFCDILDETDSSSVNPTTRFKELEEWSSIIALSLIAMVDENYDVTLDTEDIRSAVTLEELYNKIQAKK